MAEETNGFSAALCGQYREKVDQLEKECDIMAKKLDKLVFWGLGLMGTTLVGIVILIIQNAAKG